MKKVIEPKISYHKRKKKPYKKIKKLKSFTLEDTQIAFSKNERYKEGNIVYDNYRTLEIKYRSVKTGKLTKPENLDGRKKYQKELYVSNKRIDIIGNPVKLKKDLSLKQKKVLLTKRYAGLKKRNAKKSYIKIDLKDNHVYMITVSP